MTFVLVLSYHAVVCTLWVYLGDALGVPALHNDILEPERLA